MMAYAKIPPGKLKRKQDIKGSYGAMYQALWNKGVFKNKLKVTAKVVDKDDGQLEVEVLSKLDHPNIVKLLGVVDGDVDFCIVLEFCEGGSLRSYLNAHRGRRLGGRFYDWVKQAGRPIAYLKTMGVTFKDIKSASYLITNDFILKLCDFGLAKNLDAAETASYPWMAPELLRDNILSPSYDGYAFGVVVWELWTTDDPFEDSKEPADLIWRICDEQERPPIPLDCPKPIADLLGQCWEVDWTKRPSMDEVMMRLESVEQEVQKTFIDGHWELEKEFGHQDGSAKIREASNITVCPNGDFAILDYRARKVFVYNSEIMYKFHLDLWQGMNPGVTPRPWNVAVNDEGVFYITCIHYVLMCTAQGDYYGRWVALSPDSKPSDTEDTKLLGLTIDNNSQLLVGQIRNRMYISKHRQDGSHVASIKTNVRPTYLAISSYDTIIVSDDWSNTVQIIDYIGHVLHTLNTKQQVSVWNPRGICIYDNIILVCNSDLRKTHMISCFSVSAEYIGSITVGHRPVSVTMTMDSSRLLVACDKRILVYIKNVANH